MCPWLRCRDGVTSLSPKPACAGGLKIVHDRCPQLLHEAELYRYSDAPADKQAETPVDDHNHALAAALRYLISRLEPWRGCGDGGYGWGSAA